LAEAGGGKKEGYFRVFLPKTREKGEKWVNLGHFDTLLRKRGVGSGE